MFYINSIVYLQQNKNVNSIADISTNDILECLGDLIDIRDITTFTKEEIYPIEGNNRGYAKTRYTKNSYSGNHYKVLEYGVILNNPNFFNKPAIVTSCTLGLWGQIIASYFEVFEGNIIDIEYNPEQELFYYLFRGRDNVYVHCMLHERKVGRIFIF